MHQQQNVNRHDDCTFRRGLSKSLCTEYMMQEATQWTHRANLPSTARGMIGWRLVGDWSQTHI